MALADKIDTLAGFFAIGEKPTGSKDPFALRRAALGVIRLILENALSLGLRGVFVEAFKYYSKVAMKLKFEDSENPLERYDVSATAPARADEVACELMEFVADRLETYLRDRGNPP